MDKSDITKALQGSPFWRGLSTIEQDSIVDRVSRYLPDSKAPITQHFKRFCIPTGIVNLISGFIRN